MYPLALLYSLVTKIRNKLYDINFYKSQSFEQPTIVSVGNIAVGGTGKTPHTEFLINHLSNTNKIAVLSRGYRRKSTGFRYVTPNSEAKLSGDEPLQMAKKFPQTTVAVCEDRINGIKKITKDKNINLILLDDAFQHRKITPHASILLTTYANPFFKDYFLPVGRLRDNKNQYKRADIIIITKCPNDISIDEKKIWQEKIKLQPNQKMFFSREKYLPLKGVFVDSDIKIDENYDILAVSGIANSEKFVNYIKKQFSPKIKHLNYKDHKDFSPKDIQKIERMFFDIANENKVIITTEKDAVKLKDCNFSEKIRDKIYYQPIKIEIFFGEEQKFLDVFNDLIIR